MPSGFLRSKVFRRTAAACVLLCAAALAVLIACDYLVASSARGRVYSVPDAVPRCDVALVLGTSPLVSGQRTNLYFKYRMDAAAELFAAQRVRRLIVSGSKVGTVYDEPGAMRDALVARGVPASAITLDCEGFHTINSVVRAGSVFGQSRIVIVSQEFHCTRAVYMADRCGIDAVGYTARMPGGVFTLVIRAKESVSRAWAVLDGWLSDPKSRYGGPPQPIVLTDHPAR